MILQIIIAALGSAGLFSFVQFLIVRHDRKKNITKQLDRLELATARTQLLLLINQYPGNKHEIMTVAEHYFGNLGGDWYMSTIFNDYLNDQNIAKPQWFKED